MDIEDLTKKDKVDSEIWVTDFDTESALKFREKILEASECDPTRPIIVRIDSYGGTVDSLASMIETIDEVPNSIVTVAVGKAMSCGAVLLSHGDVRFCGKHSRIMIHEVSSGTVGNVHDMGSDIEETKRHNKWFMGLLAKNCGIRGGYNALRKMIKALDGRDKYMNADEAVKFGIVDAIGMPTLSSVKLHQVGVIPQKAKMIAKKQPIKKNKGKRTKRLNKS